MFFVGYDTERELVAEPGLETHITFVEAGSEPVIKNYTVH